MTIRPPYIQVAEKVQHAIKLDLPVVALESTVITHGLPYPENLELAQKMEQLIARRSVTPATIALVRGHVKVGLSRSDLQTLAQAGQNAIKVSRRDFATAIVKEKSGGTTVAGTLFVAHKTGIKVFATGGIGGVHRGHAFDISTDLQALAQTPVIVVCAGAKAILDLPATLEYLETMGVPVVGYGTDEFPAFYFRKSGLPVSVRLDSPQEVADFARAHWELGMSSAVLVANPIPQTDEIPMQEIAPVIERAIQEAQDKNIRGQAITPFLLQRLGELTGRHTLHANLSLLENNALVAADIATAISKQSGIRTI